jgi:CheY-like chemotaxis protein
MTRLLIRNAGHELRTPLNSIINYLEVALEEILDEQARSHLQMSLQASKSLVFVVNDLLNLTEIEDVNFNIHEENVDLRNLLCEVITAFQAEAAKRHLTVDLDANLFASWTVRTDPTSLRQVVSNLLANAIKYSNRGHVQVHMDEVIKAESNTTIEISFEDEGSGLSEQHLNTIFQSFERILDEDESHTTELSSDIPASEATPRGIGLGLAVTARFVRLTNGQIKISSEGEGKGTRVSIIVPFRKALQDEFGKRVLSPETPLQTPRTDLNFGNLRIDSNIPPSSGLGEPLISPEGSKLDMAHSPILTYPFDGASPSSPDSSSRAIGKFPFPPSITAPEQSLTILVAEDNPLNSRLLKTRLAKRGHEVAVTVNGQDCFDAFIKSSQTFDVILMDMQMPIVDGTEATHLIREAEEEKKLFISEQGQTKTRIPIIAVSASLKEHSRQEYISAGFNGWILKPIDFKRLENILAAVKDEALKDDMVYGEGNWDKGGWFWKLDT